MAEIQGTEVALFNGSDLAKIVSENLPIIQSKTTNLLAAFSNIKSISSADEDTAVEELIVKGSNTFTTVEQLTFAITRPVNAKIDEVNAYKAKIKAEVDRAKTLRNGWANELVKKAKEKQKEIDDKKVKDSEISRIKSEMKKAVETGISLRVAKGENAIAEIFKAITLETFNDAEEELNFNPSLKEEFFRSLLDVTYNNKLVTVEEYADLSERAFTYFDFNKCNSVYIEEVKALLSSWKEKLPAKKAELQRIAKASENDAAKLIEEATQREEQEARDREKILQTALDDINTEAESVKNKGSLDVEFEAQVESQAIETPDNVRGNVRYRFAEEDLLIQNPLVIIDLMSKVMLNVMTEKGDKDKAAPYLGHFKRVKSGMPDKDENGKYIYLDCFDYWLKLLAKCKPLPEIPGLIIERSVTAITKDKSK